MKVQVTAIVGEPEAPFAGFSKEEFVYAEGASEEEAGPRDILAGIQGALEVLDEAKRSLERQACAAQATLGTGPEEGS